MSWSYEEYGIFFHHVLSRSYKGLGPVSYTHLDVYKRQTEYGLEQVYNVIDSRYRSRKPLIVTTNLTLQEIQNPEDTAHARIYDRLLEMCLPIHFSGVSQRRKIAQEKMERLKQRISGKESQ